MRNQWKGRSAGRSKGHGARSSDLPRSRRDDCDVVVVGAGVAGLSVALGLSARHRVVLITSGALGGGCTAWAQGGIAVADGPDDSPELHAGDTVTAGRGLCDPVAVGRLVGDAAERVAELVGVGARFDAAAGGALLRSREGGHGLARVIHAGGDATGAEVSRALVAAVRGLQAEAKIHVLEHSTVLDLVVSDVQAPAAGRRVSGVAVEARDGTRAEIRASTVVLATGGAGQCFAATTNPGEVTGAGLALALRAGAALSDIEFVQFHPTALWTPGPRRGQVPLVTEALRGAGAVLRDLDGTPLMTGVHPLGDLAPRDVVARAIDAAITAHGVGGHALLDATRLDEAGWHEEFPTVFEACHAHGIDPLHEPIPVAPAEHFLCGGVQVDSWGMTDVSGLFAVGEVASTGVHGANRLASNSLLEGLVFASRVVRRIDAGGLAGDRSQPATSTARPMGPVGPDSWLGRRLDPAVDQLARETLSAAAGVRRTGSELARAAQRLHELAGRVTIAGNHEPQASDSRRAAVTLLVAQAIVAAAEHRTESRGCHWRDDHPAADPSWQVRTIVRLDDGGRPQARSDRLALTA